MARAKKKADVLGKLAGSLANRKARRKEHADLRRKIGNTVGAARLGGGR
jgi:hypothetical protein